MSLPKQVPSMPDVGAVAWIGGLATESLLTLAWDGRVVPRICESWEWLPHGAGIRLKLRKNVLFHDGTELTSDILAESIRRAITEQRPGSYRSVTRVVVAAPDLVDIHLKGPNSFLPEEISEIRLTRGKDGLVGTGPFMRVPDNALAVSAFDRYYQGPPKIARIEVQGYPTLRNAWSAMMRDDINMLYEVSRDAVEFVEKESSVRAYEFTRAYYYFVAFNMRHPVLQRREVRQALSQAVDRQAIVTHGMQGRAEPADGPIWKYHWAYSTQRSYQYNPEAARLRLDAAGLRSRVSPADQMPSRLRFTCLMFGEEPRFERIALVLQKQLYEIGVDMNIEALPLRELALRMGKGDFDAVLTEYSSGRSLSWLYRVWHSPVGGSAAAISGLDTGYRAADDSLEKLRRAGTDADTRAAVSEVQRVLYEEPPALFLAWPQTARAVHASIEVPMPDWPAKPGADIVVGLWQARPAPAGVARR